MLGAIVAPSRFGTRYASGTFRRGDTVLHVSQGTSSLAPLRYNCPPELGLLTLIPA
jgi:predicted MPP superfamily phosphohydrolase